MMGPARWSAVLAVALLCIWGAVAQSRPASTRGTQRDTHRQRTPAAASQPAAEATSQPSAQPATPDAPETIATARRRIARMPPPKRSHHEWTLLTALDFALAAGKADGRRAASLVDAVGYQPLPLDGELPEKPGKPLSPAAVERMIAARLKLDVADYPAECLEVVTAAGLRAVFPAVATWMLPQEDFAVVFRPAAPGRQPNWLLYDACLVIRVRGGRAAILGGNLLEALTTAEEQYAPEPEQK